jgi:hypothetical protein
MASVPDYVAAARPVPPERRQAWYKNTAPVYAGIMLWFVFWQDVAVGEGTFAGLLSVGWQMALIGLTIAALICHYGCYLAPGLLGMKTGLPLYVVGTSTYGVRGGFLMPGFLMGVLQFGWLAVSAFAVSQLFCRCFGLNPEAPALGHGIIATVFALLAVFAGLMGIRYVAKVATYLPLIPLAILVFLTVRTIGGLPEFETGKLIDAGRLAAVKNAEQKEAEAKEAEKEAAEPKTAEDMADTMKGPRTKSNMLAAKEAAEAANAQAQEAAEAAKQAATDAKAAITADESLPLGPFAVLAFLSLYVVGFFATAGAAGADFGMNNRNPGDVNLGGLVGIVLVTVVAGGLAILIVAGAHGAGLVPPGFQDYLNPVKLMPTIFEHDPSNIWLTENLHIGTADLLLLLLAFSAFAPACFPAFIAANSFRTTMPKVSPWISVGAGTAAAIALAVTGWAGKVVLVFLAIGASFGPICGAMAADYLLAGRQWAGPRAGFNPAGWISWVLGFAVGSVNFLAKIPGLGVLKDVIPAPPVAAILVGFVVYLILAKLGLESSKLEMPPPASD